MRSFVKALVLVPLALVLVLVAVANREIVVLSLDPFSGGNPPALSLSAPLFVLLLGAAILGVLVGGFAAWLSQGRYRRSARRQRRELNRLREQMPAPREPQAPGRAVLPSKPPLS